MGRKNRIVTSSRSSTTRGVMELQLVRKGLSGLERCVRTARKNGFRVGSHEFYDSKARQYVATIAKNLIVLGRSFQEGDPAFYSTLSGIQFMVEKCDLNSDPAAQLKLLRAIRHRLDSEIAATVESERRAPAMPFLPPEMIPNGTYRRVLEEANTCFETHCYNACSAMLRRLVESLIIEVFEARGIQDTIKVDDDYCELKALIGKAAAELRLGRNSREALPKLKFLGDLGVHSRRNLIRRGDLERFHSDIRVTLEELASQAFGPATSAPVRMAT